jgi:hypothetical protein
MQGLKGIKPGYLPLVLVPLVVVVAVVMAAGDGTSAHESKALSTAEKSAIRRTEALLSGIPQRGSALGSPQAPVTLQFFGDLQCPDARRVMLGALPYLIRHWVREGKLRILYRSTQSDTLGLPEFQRQQAAALAAGRQDMLWTYVDLFYREQRPEHTRYADGGFLEGIAEQTSMDVRHWARDRSPWKWAKKLESDAFTTVFKGLDRTPSFLIGPTGGEARALYHFTFEEPGVFDEAIRELL